MKIHFVSLLWPLLFTLVNSKPLVDDSSEITTTTQSSSTSSPPTTTTSATTTPVPKIQLNALLSAVQQTVVHSAQNLVNITKLNSTDGNTIISVPITLSTSTQKINTTNEEQIVTPKPITEKVENIKPLEDKPKLPTTGTNQQNISMVPSTTPQLSNASIAENSTSSIIRTEEKITLFSPGAVVFPSIPAILAEDYKPITSTSTESQIDTTTIEPNAASDEDDCTSDQSSSGESNEKCEIKKNLSKKTATQVKKAEILKEKIAEVEAEPVILTQGI